MHFYLLRVGVNFLYISIFCVLGLKSKRYFYLLCFGFILQNGSCLILSDLMWWCDVMVVTMIVVVTRIDRPCLLKSSDYLQSCSISSWAVLAIICFPPHPFIIKNMYNSSSSHRRKHGKQWALVWCAAVSTVSPSGAICYFIKIWDSYQDFGILIKLWYSNQYFWILIKIWDSYQYFGIFIQNAFAILPFLHFHERDEKYSNLFLLKHWASQCNPSKCTQKSEEAKKWIFKKRWIVNFDENCFALKRGFDCCCEAFFFKLITEAALVANILPVLKQRCVFELCKRPFTEFDV